MRKKGLTIRLWKQMIAGIGVLALLLAPGIARAQNAAKLTVAAAANLQDVMKVLKPEFERQSHVDLQVVFGASGNFTTQIENGAPFDVFVSADMDFPRRLIGEHLADPASLFPYAIGRLVLLTPPGSTLDLNKLGIQAVLEPSVTRLAIANPRTAPYGRAAVEALRHFNLYDKVASKLVTGENIGQAAQFVRSGNAQLGFVPLSLVIAPESKGAYIEVPADSYAPIEQGAVILTKASNRGAADQFLAFLKQAQTQQTFRKFGYSIPGKH